MKRLVLLLIFLSSGIFAQQTGARYLIITHDNFYSAIQPLAQWKHKKGMRTKVVKLSEIGSSSSAIRTYIVNAYNTWQIKPEYILFVGAPNYLPYPSVNYTVTDNYYTNMDGDVFNEILSGRLTVHNASEAQNVVNKILLYERTPYTNTADSLWFINACLIANLDYEPYSDSIYWSDIHYAKNFMLQADWNKIDTLSNDFGNSASDVINRVNQGRSIVMYRGVGTNNWYYPFDCTPSQTANGARLPIVLSFTCNTIGQSGTPAAAEMWLLTGSVANPKGAAGYFATTTSIMNGAYLRSATCKGFMDGMFSYHKRTFGEACESGRMKVYNMYGNTSEYRGFNTIGDPEMNIWTAIPKPVEVLYDHSLNIADDSLTVTVKQNSVPFESALVCLVLDTLIYEYNCTANNGEITFYFDTLYPGAMAITVTGRNVVPYEDTINVLSTNEPVLVYRNYAINDSLGNNNGYPENNETILLKTLITNEGSLSAYDVQAKLRSSDPMIFIIDSVSSFGDISPQDSSFGFNPFVFSISPFCPNGHVINFNLAMADSLGNTWSDNFSIATQIIGGAIGPDQYGYYIYDDTDTLTGNAPVFDWLEIAPPGPGALVSEITNEDADTVTYALPFNFKYYGINYSALGLCSNGFQELGFSTYRLGDNGTIPLAGGPKRLLAPFWDDLDPSAYGDIYYYNDTANHCWIIEFKDVAHYDNPAFRETFQTILLDPQFHLTPTNDGKILFLYSNVADASSNTIGMEDNTESRGIQYLYENSYNANAASIISHRALLISTTPPFGTINTPWLYIINDALSDSLGGNNNGIIEPGETIAVYVSVKNAGDTMAYNVDGILRCSDPDAEVLDSTNNFGDIAVGSIANNLANGYKLYINPNLSDSVVGLVLSFTCNNNTYHNQDYFTIYAYGSTSIMEHQLTGENCFGLTVYPNPCRTTVTIKFQIPYEVASSEKKVASIRIYDVAGRLVRDFPINQLTIQPFNQVAWDGTDDLGRKVPEGIYFISLTTDDYQRTVKVIFLK